jgi:hypothetical protein
MGVRQAGMNPYVLTRPFRFLGERALDLSVRERLSPVAEGSDGNVSLHLEFNARLVTALREQKLWPPRTETLE